MRSLLFNRPILAATLGTTLAVAALSLAIVPAQAQTLIVTTGTHTESTNFYQNGTIDVFNSATLNVVTGGSVLYALGNDTSTVNISGGSVTNAEGEETSTVNISGGNITSAHAQNTSTMNISGGNVITALVNTTSTMNITGGSVTDAIGYSTSTVNISGGNVTNATGNISSTVNISGGSVTNAIGIDTSTVNIYGGNVTNADAGGDSAVIINGGNITNAIGRNNSTTFINGGTLTNGLLLFNAGATANFIGTGLSFAYQSYGNSTPYGSGVYADFFQVSGTIGGAATTYDLYIYNDDGFGGAGTPNSASRQFLFNGLTPAIVPEAGTFALILPALGVLGMVAVRRRK